MSSACISIGLRIETPFFTVVMVREARLRRRRPCCAPCWQPQSLTTYTAHKRPPNPTRGCYRSCATALSGAQGAGGRPRSGECGANRRLPHPRSHRPTRSCELPDARRALVGAVKAYPSSVGVTVVRRVRLPSLDIFGAGLRATSSAAALERLNLPHAPAEGGGARLTHADGQCRHRVGRAVRTVRTVQDPAPCSKPSSAGGHLRLTIGRPF